VTENDDGESAIPRIYTLQEAADILRVELRWLRARLAGRRLAGLKRGGRWAMTEPQILAAIESMTVPVREPESYPGGITRRSWLLRQRGGTRGAQPSTVTAYVPTLPSYFCKVSRESPQAIAAMSELTQTQQQLLERLQREGTLVLDGRGRKSVEALVRRGLATYEAEYVLSETSGYYVYRFTVGLREES
jgi:hypothetical protein